MSLPTDTLFTALLMSRLILEPSLSFRILQQKRRGELAVSALSVSCLASLQDAAATDCRSQSLSLSHRRCGGGEIKPATSFFGTGGHLPARGRVRGDCLQGQTTFAGIRQLVFFPFTLRNEGSVSHCCCRPSPLGPPRPPAVRLSPGQANDSP